MNSKVKNTKEQRSKNTTERKHIEEAIKKNQYYLTEAQKMGKIGAWEIDLIKNDLIWTDQNYINFGVPVGTPLTYEIFLGCIHSDDKEYVNFDYIYNLRL